jgi:hypothetical protein
METLLIAITESATPNKLLSMKCSVWKFTRHSTAPKKKETASAVENNISILPSKGTSKVAP